MAKKGKVKKALTVAGFIFKVLWLIVAFVIFFHGLKMFRKTPDLMTWIIWGALCLIPTLGDSLHLIISGLMDGARSGSHHYTATVDQYGVSVSNNSLKEAFWGLIAGVFCALLFGPVFLGFKIVPTFFDVLKFISGLIKARTAKSKSSSENE